ncbi:MAG TPA: glycoside hydrolase family 15 protein [Acidimicrobiales bacterium]|nr:glycoside hydrolase family 15 protein [Acidimicrobiales bacterium]
MSDAELRFRGAAAPGLAGAAPSPFPAIADYAFLSDCECSALVASSGNVEWLCLPRPDGPSVFGSMLDRAAGGFRLAPVDVSVPAGRRYLPGTMVLETTWQTRTGWVIVRDALLVGPWYHGRERLRAQRRPPTDHEAEGVLLRTVKCVNGSVEIAVDCEPVFGYGLYGAAWEYAGEGFGQAVARPGGRSGDGDGAAEAAEGVAGDGVGVELRLVTDLRVGFEGRRASVRSTLHEGDNVFVALSWGDRAAPTTYEESFDRMEVTADFWREWLNHGDFPDHPWRAHLQRSALTLKGLTYAPTGAMLAAATTSLPETPGGTRNWDYRYSWVRDSTFMLWGLYTLGFDAEANDFFAFVADAVDDGSPLQVLYGVGGERTLEERELGHLGGYDGARPVRVGNGAYGQDQHDIWGTMLDSVYLHTRSRDHLPERVWPLLVRQVEAALAHWREPDRGIWEVRGAPQHFTSSKVMCWVAADRGARLARLRDDADTETRWAEAAAEIRDDVCTNGVGDRGTFTQHYGSEALDASLLLLPLVRFLPAGDERIRATVLAVADELTVDGLVHRYHVDQTDDGVGGEEGAFAICSFWLVSAMTEIGEIARARQMCEKLLNYASPLGLYAEEIDPCTGRHLGNFPQAFTHLALINALVHVIRADGSAPGRGPGWGWTPSGAGGSDG